MRTSPTAVAFDNAVPAEEIVAYRAAFAEVSGVLAAAGLSADSHGSTAHQPLFSRTNADWRAGARQWLADPVEHDGAMMTSLLVDGRPIHGDPGLPAVIRVFSDLREHPGTMRLLLQESLAWRAKLHSAWGIFARRPDTFNIKAHALLPVVNIARWAALSVGSAVLPTTERLRAAAGSAMLPDEAASTLIEVFDVLQRLRLRYQLGQYRAGEQPTDPAGAGRRDPELCAHAGRRVLRHGARARGTGRNRAPRVDREAHRGERVWQPCPSICDRSTRRVRASPVRRSEPEPPARVSAT